MKVRKTKQIFTVPETRGDTITGDSLTVPDQSMSVQEMLERHVQGVLDPSMVYEGLYDDDNVNHDDDLSHREQRDQLELLELAHESKKTIKEIEDLDKTISKQKKQEAKEAEQSGSSSADATPDDAITE